MVFIRWMKARFRITPGKNGVHSKDKVPFNFTPAYVVELDFRHYFHHSLDYLG